MIIVFTAKDSIEANIVKGMLEANGIEAYITGEYLQGGIGELPAMGLIDVHVDEQNREQALKLINDYETGQYTVSI